MTTGGTPVVDEFLAILDSGGDFAAGVVTDAAGQYAVTSLKPGDYTINTSVGMSNYVSVTAAVTLEKTVAKTVDFALDPGATVRFTMQPGTGAVVAELRNQAERVMKVYLGDPAGELGGEAVLRGLPPAQYKLYVRRAGFPFAAPGRPTSPGPSATWMSSAGPTTPCRCSRSTSPPST